jgi:hypothetical protein
MRCPTGDLARASPCNKRTSSSCLRLRRSASSSASRRASSSARRRASSAASASARSRSSSSAHTPHGGITTIQGASRCDQTVDDTRGVRGLLLSRWHPITWPWWKHRLELWGMHEYTQAHPPLRRLASSSARLLASSSSAARRSASSAASLAASSSANRLASSSASRRASASSLAAAVGTWGH